MKVVRKLDEAVWRAFVDSVPGGNIFHTPEMFRVFSSVPGYTPHLWAATDSAGTPLALLTPVAVQVGGGLFPSLTTRLLHYGGLLAAPGANGMGALAHVLGEYLVSTARDAVFSEVRHQSACPDVSGVLEHAGFRFEPHLTYRLCLKDPAEQILQGMGKRVRKGIRRGLRDPRLEVREIRDLSELDAWYAPLQSTYRQARVPMAPRALFESALRELLPLGHVRFNLALVDGLPAACGAELCFKDEIYGWYGGTDREFSSFQPTEAVTWEILDWGARNGYSVYDFGGAGHPDKPYGVRDFKAKFGGAQHDFGRHLHVPSPMRFSVSRVGYALVRGLASVRRRN